MSQSPATIPPSPLSLSSDPTPGLLPRGPLSPQQQLEALRRVQIQAEKRVQLGQRLFRAAEASATQHHAAMAQLRQDQDQLRKQLQEDLSRTVQAYDQWIGRIDTDLAAAVTQMQQKIEQLQEQWSQAQVRLEAMAARSDALLMQATDLLAQTGDLLTQSINERTERSASESSPQSAHDSILDERDAFEHDESDTHSQRAIAPELCAVPQWAVNLPAEPLELAPPLLLDDASPRIDENVSWLPTLLPAFANGATHEAREMGEPGVATTEPSVGPTEESRERAAKKHDIPLAIAPSPEPIARLSEPQVLEIQVIDDEAAAPISPADSAAATTRDPHASEATSPAAADSDALSQALAAEPAIDWLGPYELVTPDEPAIEPPSAASTAAIQPPEPYEPLETTGPVESPIARALPVFEQPPPRSELPPAEPVALTPLPSDEPESSASLATSEPVALTPLPAPQPAMLTPLPMRPAAPEPEQDEPQARQPLRFDDPSVPRVARDPDLWVMLPMSPEDQIEDRIEPSHEAPSPTARMLPSLHHPALCERLPEGTDPIVEQVLSHVVSPASPQAISPEKTSGLASTAPPSIASSPAAISSLRTAQPATQSATQSEPISPTIASPNAPMQPRATMTPLSVIPPAKPGDSLSIAADPDQTQDVTMPSDFYRRIVQRLRDQVDNERGD